MFNYITKKLLVFLALDSIIFMDKMRFGKRRPVTDIEVRSVRTSASEAAMALPEKTMINSKQIPA